MVKSDLCPDREVHADGAAQAAEDGEMGPGRGGHQEGGYVLVCAEE